MTGARLTTTAALVAAALALATAPACDGGARSACDVLVAARRAAHVARDGPDLGRALDAGEQQIHSRAIDAMSDTRYEEVRPLLGPLLDWEPPHPQVQFTAAYAAFELAENGEAVRRFDDAFARAPELLPFSSGLGFALWKMGRFDEARCAFESALAADPQAYKARYGLGRVELSVGRLEAARGHFEAALQMEPGYRRARLNLARVLEEQGELEQALPLVERVVVEWPSHEEALYLLARVLGRLGRADDAELVLERRAEAYAVREVVVALETEMRTGRDRPDLHAEMVALYVRLGDLGMAREAMAAGLSRFPDDPLLRALRQDLPDLLSRRRHPLPYLGDAAPPGPEAGGAPANPVDPR